MTDSLYLAKLIAWTISLDSNLTFQQARDQVGTFYSGSRSIHDADVVAHLRAAPDINTALQDQDIINRFLATFDKWIVAHGSNRIDGISNFQSDLSQGTSQAFDSFYNYAWNKRLRFFHGEYFYHVLAMIRSKRPWCWLPEASDLKSGDALVLSVPFCDTGGPIQDLDTILQVCDRIGVPVLLDCAYWCISQDIKINLDHECINTIAFSLSKTFPCGHARIGVRYTRPDHDDGQRLHQRIGYNNRLSAALGMHLISKFSSDYIPKKYRDLYLKITTLLGLSQNHSVIFADGDSNWSAYGRHALLQTYGLDLDAALWRNRICLTRLLEKFDLIEKLAIIDHEN